MVVVPSGRDVFFTEESFQHHSAEPNFFQCDYQTENSLPRNLPDTEYEIGFMIQWNLVLIRTPTWHRFRGLITLLRCCYLRVSVNFSLSGKMCTVRKV